MTNLEKQEIVFNMITINTKKCLRSRGINCFNCIQVCPMHVIVLRDNVAVALKPEKCIACHCCKGSCPAGLETISVEDLPCNEATQPLEWKRTSPAIRIQLGRIQLKTPLILASGPIGRCAQGLSQASSSGLGAVVTKTITLKPRKGNPSIRILPYGGRSIVNCEGLPNLGVNSMAEELKSLKSIYPNAIVVPSLSANIKEEFYIMAERMEAAGADALELALHGCHNVAEASKATPARRWIEDPFKTAKLVEAVRRVIKIPIWVKVNDYVDTAIACQEAGADALIVRQRSSMGMPLDTDTGQPLLSHPWGQGVFTGPHTKIMGCRAVAEISQRVSIPIIGNGGIFSAQDVIDYISSGATSVQLLTVLIRRDLSVINKIIDNLEAYITKYQIANIENLRGKTLQYLRPKNVESIVTNTTVNSFTHSERH